MQGAWLVMRDDESAFIYVEVNAKEYEIVILKLRLGAININRNCELAGAMICVCDNDTSGVIQSDGRDGARPMWAV